jgi:hypothetical protein
MSTAGRSRVGAALLTALCLISACSRKTGYETDKRSSSPAPAGSELDGMQLASARRVAIESAIAAMKRRDLARLKQLSLWVRGRAQVAVLEPNELQALDLAIQCLEQVAPPSAATAKLDALGPGQLQKATRGVCGGSGEKPNP